MTTLTLGKVKLVNKGAWSSTATYSKGDVVTYNGQSFVYHNDTPKAYTALFFGSLSNLPLSGTIATLAGQTDTFTVTWASALPSTSDSRIVPGSLYAYCKFIESDAKVLSITHLSTTQSTITVSKRSNSTGSQSSVAITIGTRRLGGKYEVSFNDTDWDRLSEGLVYVGDWSSSTAYLPGQIVTRNGNSYQCVAGIDGIDPLWDYVGAWEPFLVSNEGLPHERVLTTPNTNPWGWRGHPYVPCPNWGTANTYTGIPWNLPSTHKNSYFAGRWNSTQNRMFMDYRGTSAHWSDAQGNEIAKGNTYYNWGAGGGDGMRLHAGEAGPMLQNDYYSDEAPNYGNVLFAQRNGTAGPRCIQSGHAWAHKLILMSNGSVLSAGDNSYGMCGLGYDTNPNMPMSQIPRASFSNRSIVKIAQGAWGSRDGANHNVALDEFGEVWTWGYNGHGQCGTGYDPLVYANFRQGQDNHVYSPVCLNKDLFFEGNRIVDIACASYSTYALDEAGNLWSWGYNNYGQLGYPTNSGFNSTDRNRNPKKIPITWSSYGGIQKFVACSQEGADWLTVLDGQGHIWNCGYNGSGQLGRNNTTNDSNASTITRTSSTSGWSIGGGIKNFWCGHANNPASYFLDTSLNLWACGYSSHYNIGSGSSDKLLPVQEYGPNGAVTEIVTMANSGRAGGGSQHFLDINGVAYGTGWNGYGECGIGTTDYPGNNPRNQQSGQSSTATIQRVILPNAWQKDIVDLNTYGDYDSSSSHITLCQYINSRGEMLQTGREYNYTNPYNWGHSYAPCTVPNFF